MSHTNFTVKDLPPDDRPRERLEREGKDKLSDIELFALILGSGFSGMSVMDTAKEIKKRFHSLVDFKEASLQDFRQIKGLGKAKASQLVACAEISRRIARDEAKKRTDIKNQTAVTSSSIAAELARNQIEDFNIENFIILSFNSRNKLVAAEVSTIGTLTSSLVHPRETFKAAIRNHAAKIMIAHNHPSGETDPSDDDIKITKRLSEGGKILGIELIDHIIVTPDDFFSFKDEGLL
ncbi:MAG: DNA repair protein RadC [Ignavibacteria bacterium]|nr:DNA repair protein RadC [Ignavibacteria bacterium]